MGEALYRYNAELALPFNQAPDTVYWLKIAALVDVPQPIALVADSAGRHAMGLAQPRLHHQRSAGVDAPTVNPGEFIDGTVPGTNIPIWHFQDDAVTGILDYTPVHAERSELINQFNMSPANYQFVNSNGVGPIDGPAGIELHSKDLAFRLYTQVPEPASCALVVIAMTGLFAIRRR